MASRKSPAKPASAAEKTTGRGKTVASKSTTAKAPREVKGVVPRAKPTSAGPRRAIFIDVENTSSEAALLGALEQLTLDRVGQPTEVVAVGNWRVIGLHVARTLARQGCRLLHTAPATGVKDWSDLSIAVAAGTWLGRAAPGDSLDIVSADRAFDAVGDAAAVLGVSFRRLAYGVTSGTAERIEPAEGVPHRRSRRGGRRRRGGRGLHGHGAPREAATALAARAPSEPEPALEQGAVEGSERDIHAAPGEEVVATIARLTARDPGRGVNLDLLINALKAEGYGRPPGSPRLVTRLRKLKGVEVSPTGMVRLMPGTAVHDTRAPHGHAGRDDSPMSEAAVGEAESEAVEPTGADAPKPARRSRRRGGRRGGRRRRSEGAPAGAAPEPPSAK